MDVNPRGSVASAILCPLAMSCARWLYPVKLHVSFGPLPMHHNQLPLSHGALPISCNPTPLALMARRLCPYDVPS